MKRVLRPCSLVCLVFAACEDTRLVEVDRVPASVRITVSPVKNSYLVEETVTLGTMVLDAQGIIMEGFLADWETPPAEAVAPLGGNRYQFLAQGDHRFRVTLREFPDISDTATLSAVSVPASVAITVDPEKDYYGIGEQVRLGYVVRDKNGAELKAIGATWQAPNPAQVQADGAGAYTFLAEGTFTWVVTLDAPWGQSASVTLRADGGAPEITIEFPERGDTILKDTERAEVSIRGRVSDTSAGISLLRIRSNTLAETAVSVQPNGTFAAVAPAVPGLNVVVVEAQDKAGNASRATRAFYYAADFFEPEGSSRTVIPRSEHALISDLAWDRGRPTDNPPFDPCTIGPDDRFTCSSIPDIATLLELVLNNVDFASLKPTFDRHFPLVDQRWNLDLEYTDLQGNPATISLILRLEGFFDLHMALSEFGPGIAKVTSLLTTDGGIHMDASFGAYTDSQGVVHPGLTSALGMTGTLQFLLWLDLATSNPQMHNLLCNLSSTPILCNPADASECLYNYLESCSPVPSSVGSLVSVIDTPVLAGMGIEQVLLKSDLEVALSGKAPKVDLSRIKVEFGQGNVDVSALEDLTIQLGKLRLLWFDDIIDLGTYEFPSTFLSDLAEQLLEPVMEAILPLLEPIFGFIFRCNDPERPACMVIPFLEKMLQAFAGERTLTVENPFDALAPAATIELWTEFEELLFRYGFGGLLTLAGRARAEEAPEVAARRDDDLLGVALLGGCLATDPGYATQPTGGKALQLAAAVDLVDQMLFALWRNGGLDLSLDGAALDLEPGFTDPHLEIQPYLPAILNRCSAAEPALALELGDVHFDLRFTADGTAVEASGFASLSLGATLAIGADGQLDLATSGVDLFEIELEALSVGGAKATATDPAAQLVRELLRDKLLPAVVVRTSTAVVRQVHSLQPTFDISSFPGIDPATATLTLGQLDARVVLGRAVLNGDLVQR